MAELGTLGVLSRAALERCFAYWSLRDAFSSDGFCPMTAFLGGLDMWAYDREALEQEPFSQGLQGACSASCPWVLV